MTETTTTTGFLVIGNQYVLRDPRRTREHDVLDRRVQDGMTVTLQTERPDSDGEVMVALPVGGISAWVDATRLAPVEAEEVRPLEAEARCATTYVSGKDRRDGHLLLRPGTKVTYFPDLPWWSITPYDMDGSRVLVLVDEEGEADGYYNDRPRLVEELLDPTVMDEAPAGLRGRRGTLVPLWGAMQALSYNTLPGGLAYVIGLEWLPHLTPTADVYEPMDGKTDPSDTRSIVLSPKPLARRQRQVDGRTIHRFRLDGRTYGWYWTTVPTNLLNHATGRETLDQDSLIEALHQLQREVEREQLELENAVVDAAVEAVSTNGGEFRDNTVELLESLGLDASRIGPFRRRVTSRVTVEIEVEGYVENEDADVDNYEIRQAVDYVTDSDGHICIVFDEDYFDGGLTYANVISVDAHSTDYSEETAD